MTALVRAELLKARSSRSTIALVIVAPLFCALWTAVQALAPALGDAVGPADVYHMAQQGYVFALILGIMGMAGEFRHQTISWTFLVTPARGRVVAAKLVAYGLIGLVVAVLSALTTLVVGASLLAALGRAAFAPEVPAVLVGAMLSTVLYALLGVALAALIRSQVPAIVLACLLFMYGDYFLAWLVPDVFRWLPTGAARALSGLRLESGAVLSAWGGGLLFAGYVAAFVLLARFLTLRRDIT